MPIRKIVVAIVAASAVALSACAYTPASGVEEGDGPATEQVDTTETTTDDADTTEGAETTTDETTTEEERTEDEAPEPAVASFDQKYTYADGVEVEITRTKHGKVTGYDAEIDEDLKKGDSYVFLTARVKNGSKVKLDSYETWTMTYGADGEEAETPYLADGPEDTDITGKILPGRSKTGTQTFLIPAKYQKDPVLEFSFDYEHEAAIFSGPLA